MRRQGVAAGGFVLVLAVVLLTTNQAMSLINAEFTPIDLVGKAESIVVVQASADADNGVLALRAARVLKGSDPGIASLDVKPLLDDEDFAYRFEEIGSFPAVLFQGDFSSARDGARGNAVAAVHIGTSWYAVMRTKEGYRLTTDQLDLKAVWDGGHGPLVRAVQYILTTRRPVIPAKVGVEWESVRMLQDLPGRTADPAVVFDGRQHVLYWPSDKGDWLLTVSPSGKVSGEKFASKSVGVTYIDLDQDGKGEWVCTDGTRILKVDSNGIRPLLDGSGEVTSLSAACAGGSPAVLAVTPRGPLLIAWRDGKAAATAVVDVGLAGVRQARMLDVDGDGLADVIMATDEKLLLAAGRRDGGFGTPTEAGSLYGIGLSHMSAGDFDGDGAMDLLLTGSDEYGVILMAGDGNGGFKDALSEAGELPYHGVAATRTSGLCDINNDGLVDLYLVPVSGVPRVMFNRGFRSFGYARELDLPSVEVSGASELLGEGKIGSARAIDINNDGAQDILCVGGGKLLAIMRKPREGDLGVTLRMPETAAGPVSVWAMEGERILGGRVVTNAEPAFIGKGTKGPLELRCVWPTGRKSDQRVILVRPADMTLVPTDRD